MSTATRLDGNLGNIVFKILSFEILRFTSKALLIRNKLKLNILKISSRCLNKYNDTAVYSEAQQL